MIPLAEPPCLADVSASAPNDCNGNGVPDACEVAKPAFALGEVQLRDVYPRAMVAADFNVDGFPDLALTTTDSEGQVVLNDGHGKFVERRTFSLPGGGTSLAVSDFDLDGDPDLIVAAEANSEVWYLENDGDGELSAVTRLTDSVSSPTVLLSDLDGDGRQDVLVFDPTSGKTQLFLNSAPAQFLVLGEVELAPGATVAAADFDGDGDTDIAAGSTRTKKLVLRLNDGTNNFAETALVVSDLSPSALVAADVDEDGDVDLAIGEQGRLLLLHNDGAGLFTSAQELPTETGVYEVRFADLDQNGEPDLIFSEPTLYTVAVALSHQHELSTVVPYGTPFYGPKPGHIAVEDFDGDGYRDVAFAVFGAGVGLVRNRGDGTLWGSPRIAFGHGAMRGFEAADFDGDGVVDLALLVDQPEGGQVSVVFQRADGFPAQMWTHPSAAGVAVQGIKAADLDGDGHKDPVLTGGGQVVFFPYDGDRMFSTQGQSVQTELSGIPRFADLDGDGLTDLLGSRREPGRLVGELMWYRNEGGGMFSSRGRLPGVEPFIPATLRLVEDTDDDGDVDLVLLSGSDVVLLRNDGHGDFSDAVTAALPVLLRDVDQVAAMDLNGDRLGEVAISAGEWLTVFMNFGDRFESFSPVRTGRLAWLGSGDFDRDGDVDLVFRTYDFLGPLGNGLFFLLNKGDGYLSDPFVLPLGTLPLAAAATDADGVNGVDLAVLTGGSLDILLNVSVTPVAFDCDIDFVPDECQTDADHDGVVDACDECPAVADVDTDHDGVAQCADNCLQSYNPPQRDSDADLVGDSCDECPADPGKVLAGVCGCGVVEKDSDGDGTRDCKDACPLNPGKVTPGVCGCGRPETDTDFDGTPDCVDRCYRDPNRTQPDVCNCGEARVGELCVPYTAAPTLATHTPSPTPSPRAFAVTTTSDGLDVDLGDGECRTITGSCTLRASIQEANFARGATTIALPKGIYRLAIPGREEDDAGTGDLDISGRVTLLGSGRRDTVIDADDLDRVLHVLAGGEAMLRSLTVRNGYVEGGTSSDPGGAGIRNDGSLTLEDCAVRENEIAGEVTKGRYGVGGIVNRGRLIVRDSVITENTGKAAGAISSPGRLEVYNSEISDNTAAEVAGIDASRAIIAHTQVISNRAVNFFEGAAVRLGRATVFDSVIRDNHWGPGVRISRNGVVRVWRTEVSHNGAGVENAGQVAIVDSSIVGNSGRGLTNESEATAQISRTTIAQHVGTSGGGVVNEGVMTLVNSTISGNRNSTAGAGITNRGELSMNNVTVTANEVEAPGAAQGGGLFTGEGGRTTVHNSILAGNRSAGREADCAGPLTSLDHNLFASLEGCDLETVKEHDLLGVDPRLGPLAANGGPTLTHSLLAGSPALDSGHPGKPGARDSACAEVDQRSVRRPHGGACDIGAFEATIDCGDGVRQVSEECDDGNLADLDCCSAICQLTRRPPGDATCDDRVGAADLTAAVRLFSEGSTSRCGREDMDGNCRLDAADIQELPSFVYQPFSVYLVIP